MTTSLQRLEGPGDAELIAAVRDGDRDAYGLLFERHGAAARRLARQLVRGPDADDLVAEAFAKVLVVLQRGAGPDLAFRAYLLTAVRRLHVDRLRHAHRVHPTDDLTPFDAGSPFRDTVVEGFESAAAARAFASLPERWQVVLWHTEVEGQKPADVAPLLGMSANSVSALAYRAREGLRQAFLTMHADAPGEETCVWVHRHLGGYVRGAMARRDRARVSGHVERCRPCAAIHLELTEVNSQLSSLLAPALLGSAAAAYVATASTGGSAVAGGLLLALLDQVKDVVGVHAVTSTVAGAAATAVIGGSVAVTVHHDPEPPPVAEAPLRIAEPPAAAPPDGAQRRVPTPPVDREGPPDPTPPLDRPVGEDRRPGQAPPDPQSGEVPAPQDQLQTQPPDPSVDQPVDQPQQPPEHPGATQEPEPVPVVEVYDVAVVASAIDSGEGTTAVRVTVTGLPAGRTATLVGRSEGLVAIAADPLCLLTSLSTSLCTVDGSSAGLTFLAQATGPGSVVFEVTLDGGGTHTDSDPGNNRVSVAVS